MKIERRFTVTGRARFSSHLECVDGLLAVFRRAGFKIARGAPRDVVERAAARCAEVEAAPVERASPKRTKIVDVKAFVPVVEVAEGGFDVEVAISQEGSARPEEVARALAELAGADLAVTGVTRLELRAERGRTPAGAPGETA